MITVYIMGVVLSYCMQRIHYLELKDIAPRAMDISPLTSLSIACCWPLGVFSYFWRAVREKRV